VVIGFLATSMAFEDPAQSPGLFLNQPGAGHVEIRFILDVCGTLRDPASVA